MQGDYRGGELYLDDVRLADVVAAHGTPCYVYSRATIEARWRAYEQAFGRRAHRVCYAVKANDNLSVLRVLARLGASFDIVSGGELARVLAAGGVARDVVFSGVGKRRDEIDAAIAAGIGCFNLESAAELERIGAAAAAMQRRVAVAVRVNPDIDAATHPYISTGLRENKFGVPMAEARALYAAIAQQPWLTAHAVASHIGSQLTAIEPVIAAVRETVGLAETLRGGGTPLAAIDVGGGLGIRYREETPPAIATLVEALCAAVPEHYRIMIEPGRSVVGEAGLLLTRVEYLKDTPAKRFAIVDAAMNDLLRPALYHAWHAVRPLVESAMGAGTATYDIVGPVCESGDWLARDRALALAPGALLAFGDTGAYGAVMASNYNARPRACEVLVDGSAFHLVRARDSIDDLLRNERACLIP